jgi:hypothetical protein
MLRRFFLLVLVVFSYYARGEEVSAGIEPKNHMDDDKHQRRVEYLPRRPHKHLEKPKDDFDFSNKTLLGSNFTYGANSSYDIDFKTESALSYNKHSIENAVDFYSYYYQGAGTPARRFKGKFDGSLKYLYEIYPRWSPFVAFKYEEEYERKGVERHTREDQDYDAGIRYNYHVDVIDFTVELSHRLTRENSHDFVGTTQNIRVYTGLYYYDLPIGLGVWAEGVTPYRDVEDYTLEFGPDLSYTFPGTSFFIGLTASAQWEGKRSYEGANRLNVWAGILYLGFRI